MIPVNAVRYVRSAWPRLGLNEERCGIFEAIYSEGGEMPPIEVVAQPDGTFLLCDGMHRWFAAKRVGLEQIDAVLLTPVGIERPEDVAFRRALETATTTSLPLNRQERRLAAIRLTTTRPELSHREVAKLVGVAHSTVDRWVQQAATMSDGHPSEEDAAYDSGPSVDDVARRMARYLSEIDEARGLFDYFAPSRMGRHLAGALLQQFGDGAATRAKLLADWSRRAIQELGGGS